MKDRWTAILLAVTLGGFGAHWFYLNKPQWALFSILFFWTFIPAIHSVFLAVFWMLKDDNWFYSKYS